MFSKLSKVFGIVWSLVLFLTISTAGAEQKQYVFKLANLAGATSTHGISAQKFAKAVEAESNGKIKINVSHSGGLGSGPDNIEQLRMGTVELALIWPSMMATLDKRFAIEELPYAWSKRWQAHAAFNGELGDKLKEMAESFGIKYLAFWELGYRCLTNNVRPVTKPEELKGIKLRVAEVPLRIDLFKTLGANPIPMTWSEVYTALQLGTIDGQENPLSIIDAHKVYEVQKYLSITNHIWTVAAISVSKKTWDALPGNYQRILRINALKYAAFNNRLVAEGEEKLKKTLISKGMIVNEVDKEPFLKAMQPVWEKYASTFGKEIMDSVRRYTTEY